jgi:hypothetical protein
VDYYNFGGEGKQQGSFLGNIRRWVKTEKCNNLTNFRRRVAKKKELKVGGAFAKLNLGESKRRAAAAVVARLGNNCSRVKTNPGLCHIPLLGVFVASGLK